MVPSVKLFKNDWFKPFVVKLKSVFHFTKLLVLFFNEIVVSF